MDAGFKANSMKIGLYSITYLGLWYRGPALSLEGLIRQARRLGYEGVELDGKRPHANPAELTESRGRDLRSLAAAEGIELYALAANNDFSSPVPERRESELIYVRELIRLAARLQVPVVRVFAAWPGVTVSNGLGRYDVARRLWAQSHEGVPAEDTWSWCRDGLAQAAEYAGEQGVMLALQNHPPVTDNHRDMIRMINEIGSSALKACLDAPLVAKYEHTPMAEAIAETGTLQILSHFGGEYDRDPNGAVRGLVRTPEGLVPEWFYEDFVKSLVESGYDSYIGYELCHPLPEGAELEFASRNAALAAEYMRSILARTGAASAVPVHR
jgi:sugar phosphate isomerase/epimerase